MLGLPLQDTRPPRGPVLGKQVSGLPPPPRSIHAEVEGRLLAEVCGTRTPDSLGGGTPFSDDSEHPLQAPRGFSFLNSDFENLKKCTI